MADASRARLFTFERSTEAEGLKEQLTEEHDLVDPSRRLPLAELFSETRPGVGRSGPLQYGFDDHRREHVDAIDDAFARSIIEQLGELLRTRHAQRIILCASPRMLGKLRRVRTALPDNVDIDEIPRDLVKLTPSQLRDQLASYGLLPVASRRNTTRG